ncbi:MAG: hypothetical protein WCO56_15815 [Verrucomicrobiota bacterium]
MKTKTLIGNTKLKTDNLMRWTARSFLTGLVAFTCLPGSAALITGTPAGKILAAGSNKIMILSPSGEMEWQYPTKLTHDVWMLANGNILFADGASVTEVTLAKKVVFEYKAAEQKGGGTFACQRLANGNTLIGENSTGRVLEVDPSGKAVFTLQTSPTQIGNHHNLRMVRKLDNGNYLVCHSGARIVKEYTPKGDVVQEIKAPGKLAFSAIRTPKGTTLVASLEQIIEWDAKGNKVWECTNKELEGALVSNMTGMHLLPNGNIVTGCYQAYNKSGEGCGLLELSREKKIIWRYTNPKGDGTMMAVELLTPDGKALPGAILR